MTQRVLKSHRKRTSIIYLFNQKDRQCALPVHSSTWTNDVSLQIARHESPLTRLITLLA